MQEAKAGELLQVETSLVYILRRKKKKKLFFLKVDSCIAQDGLRRIYVAKNNLEYLILLLPPKYWDYRYTLLGLAKEKIVCFCL